MMSGPIILCCCHGCCFPALSPHNGPTMLRCQSFIWIYTTDYRAGGKHFSTYLLLVVKLNIAQVVRGLEGRVYPVSQGMTSLRHMWKHTNITALTPYWQSYWLNVKLRNYFLSQI